METTLIARTRNIAALAASALMVALLTALALSGRSPGLPELSFEPHGIVAALPLDITAAEIQKAMRGWPQDIEQQFHHTEDPRSHRSRSRANPG